DAARGAAVRVRRGARLHPGGRRGGGPAAGAAAHRGRRLRGDRDHRPGPGPSAASRGAGAGRRAHRGRLIPLFDTGPPARLQRRYIPPSQLVIPRKVHTMAERTVTIASASGLHARPAGIFAQAAAEQPATVTIEKPGGNSVQASSMLMLMTLGAGKGDEVTLRAEGEGAEESVAALAALLEKDLDAEE